MTKKLHRSQRDKIIAGVCAGLAEYFAVDPTIVRLIFILITLLWGSGILIYLILWLLMPKNPNEPALIDEEKMKEFVQDVKEKAQDFKESLKKESGAAELKSKDINKRRGGILGWILIIAGGLLLLKNIFPWTFGFYASRYWPVVFLVIGIILLFHSSSNEK